jgi:hypothetical protein
MSTFHSFPRLPFELRTLIWEITITSRIVDVRVVDSQRDPKLCRGRERRLISCTPTPTVVQVCREARSHGPYKKMFSELCHHGPDERQYVWLNLDRDMVSIDISHFADFAPVTAFIKQLRFERPNSEEDFFYDEALGRKHDFRNLERIDITCVQGFGEWSNRWRVDKHSWPCPFENVTFWDLDCGGWIDRCASPEELSRRMVRLVRMVGGWGSGMW